MKVIYAYNMLSVKINRTVIYKNCPTAVMQTPRGRRNVAPTHSWHRH